MHSRIFMYLQHTQDLLTWSSNYRYLFLGYYLPVSRSIKDLKLFPILSWISAESSEKKIKTSE